LSAAAEQIFRRPAAFFFFLAATVSRKNSPLAVMAAAYGSNHTYMYVWC